MAKVSSQLGAKLHSFLCDGLELVVPSPVHVEIILHDRDENIKILISKKERKTSKVKSAETMKYVNAMKFAGLSDLQK